MKTDTNITLKDGTNLTLLKEDNILTFTGGFEQSRYEEEIKEISIVEWCIIHIWIIIIAIVLIIYILMGFSRILFNIMLILFIIMGLFGYFFVTEINPNIRIGTATEYETSHGKKKIVRCILLKQKLNIAKKDKGLNEILKCMCGLFAILCGIFLLLKSEYLSPFTIFIIILLTILSILLLTLSIRYIWKIPFNKPPEEEFPEWKYIGHMSANKLILICLIVSAVPALVIYYLWKMFF